MHYHGHTRVFMGLSLLVMGLAMLATAVRAGAQDSFTLCHYPPGAPTNAQQITVPACAVPAHLAHGDVSCADDNICTIDHCDPIDGCFYSPLNCDDESVCTVDSCDPFAGCQNVLISCDDDNPCTFDSCDEEVGCLHQPVECAP